MCAWWWEMWTDKASLVRGMTGCDAVIHAAGLFKFWGKREDFERVNVFGTQNVAEAALQVGVKNLCMCLRWR